MKRIISTFVSMIFICTASGCGLAKGVVKDFSGYGEQLVGKVQPKEYDSYDNSARFNSPAQVNLSESVPETEIVVTNKNYNGDVRENDLAIVIGIEHYRNIPPSDFSASDAMYVKANLKAIGFEERNIMLLTNEKAALTDIKKAIESWLVNRVSPDSTVVIYYSGHGAPDPNNGKAYIVPFDGDPNYLSSTAYPLIDIYDRLGKLGAKKIVAIIDSCFSGSGGRSVIAKGARALVRMEKTKSETYDNLVVMSSTQDLQISSSSPDKKHGIFTYYFLDALQHGKRDVSEIYKYLKPKVENEARKINVDQSPTLLISANNKVSLW